MRYGIRVLLAALSLSGCATPAQQQQQADAKQWIGKPENALLQAMGAPNGSAEGQGERVLTYARSTTHIIPPGTSDAPPGLPWADTGVDAPPRPWISVCETNFTVAKGIVTAVSVRGDGCY